MFRHTIFVVAVSSFMAACSWHYNATERPNQLNLTLNDTSVDYAQGEILSLNFTAENAGDNEVALFLDGKGEGYFVQTKPWTEHHGPSLCGLPEPAPGDVIRLKPGETATFTARFQPCGGNIGSGQYRVGISAAFGDVSRPTGQVTASNMLTINADTTLDKTRTQESL